MGLRTFQSTVLISLSDSKDKQMTRKRAAPAGGGGGGGGVLASSFAGYVLLAIPWLNIDPILVTFGQMSL